MKKIFIIAVMALLSASATFAFDSNDYKVFKVLNNEKKINSLSKYLNINDEQKEQLTYIFELTDKKLKTALENEDMAAADKVVWFNLGNVKYVLTDEQYKKYLLTVNMTVNTLNNNSEVYTAEK
jgi:hypothetical protein